jgi:O-antigen/teichoic acid export membrane protein
MADEADFGSLRKGVNLAGTSAVVSAALGFASALVMSRLYGVDVVGSYALLSTPWFVLQGISTVNERVALTRELATLPRRSSSATGMFIVVLGFSSALTLALGGIVAAFAIPILRGPVGQPELVAPAMVVLVSYAIIDNSSWIYDAVLVAHGGATPLFVARTVLAATLVGAAALMRLFTASYWGPTLATVAAFVAAFLVRVATTRRYLGSVRDRDAWRQGRTALPRMLRFGLTLLPTNVATALFTQAPVLVLGSTQPVGDVGAFSRAAGIASRLDEVTFRFGEILFPSMVRRWHEADRRPFESTVRRSSVLIFVAFSFLAVTLGAVAHDFLAIFGRAFSRAAPVLVILLFAAAVNAVNTIVADACIAGGRSKFASLTGTVAPLLSIAALLPASLLFGMNGVAAAMALSPVTRAVWLLVGLAPQTTSTAVRAAMARSLLIVSALGAASVLVGIAVRTAIPFEGLAFVLGASTAGVLFTGAAILARQVTVSDLVDVLGPRAGRVLVGRGFGSARDDLQRGDDLPQVGIVERADLAGGDGVRLGVEGEGVSAIEDEAAVPSERVPHHRADR